MTLAGQRRMDELVADAQAKRASLERAQREEREAVVALIREALLCHWSWRKIASCLGVSDTAARRYYERNHMKVRSI